MSDVMPAVAARHYLRRRTRRFAVRVFIILLAVALAFALAFTVWLRNAASSSLPQLDGTIQLAGLSAPVHVTRDAQGVPHISAASAEDLFFAQGYVTAQDRLWEMDSTRRFAAGELSEVLGSGFLVQDKHQRILGLRQVAERAADNLSLRDRTFFDAYARGVNAYMEQHTNSLPLEFRLMRYSPRPWTPTDSFLVGAMMAEMLNHGFYEQKLTREKIAARLDPELVADLYVNSSYRDIVPVENSTEIQVEEASPTKRDDDAPNAPPIRHRRRKTRASLEQLSLTHFSDPLRPGSNDWVVSGTRTATGKPLLSNDMHLGHRLPNVWYEAHLQAGEIDVAGVTLPGLPFVIVGHNQRVAWGFTNVGPDVEDVFVENLNERGEYQTPDGWKPADRRQEIIRVKNGRDVTLEVEVTRHGPIITPLIPGEKRKLALKWIIYDPAALTFPFYEVNTASNWQEFRAAVARFGGPGQNVVYADVDGHIGYQATGLVPTRAAGDGSVPVNGADNAHEWTGYIPFEQMPTAFDPASGIIATANGRITPDGYPYSISTQWGSPYRTERIYRVLRADHKFTTADMLTLQTDVYSEFDRFLAERFAYAVDHSPKASDRAKRAAEILRKWDARVSKDSAAAAITTAARRHMARLMLEAKLGKDAALYSWFMSSVWLENALLFQQPRWLPQQYSSYNELLTAALEAAVADKSAPRNLDKWNYGKQNPVEISHPIFSRIPFLRSWSGPGVQPQSGNGNTIKQVGRKFGPSQRMTVDFADFDNSTLNLVNGQSGHPLSTHYNDQWSAWYNGTTFPLAFTPAAVQKARQHELVLEPAK
ncbi:MAG TPA: penicillin acylase family protein [Clostridia bacterium]|nr:penicillin acylase family protein [Clostridia bacterium]